MYEIFATYFKDVFKCCSFQVKHACELTQTQEDTAPTNVSYQKGAINQRNLTVYVTEIVAIVALGKVRKLFISAILCSPFQANNIQYRDNDCFRTYLWESVAQTTG